MRKSTLLAAAIGVAAGVYVVRRSQVPLERRDLLARQVMNRRLTPLLVRGGAANGARTGFGIVEHVGRVSGTVRRTLVHPIPLGDRLAIPVPYRDKGQWPRNVIAAGCCRLQFRDSVFTLTNPRVMEADLVADLPVVERSLVRLVGGACLVMDVESVVPGRFADADASARKPEAPSFG